MTETIPSLRRKTTLLTSNWSTSMRKDVSSQQRRYNVQSRHLCDIYVYTCTVEPPNNGHIGGGSLVHCREVVLISEVR